MVKKSKNEPKSVKIVEKPVKKVVKVEENVKKSPEHDDFRTLYGIKPCYGRTIRIQNTGDLFICSPEDWKKAIACHWFLTAQGTLENKLGISFEIYVGITSQRKQEVTDILDFSRYNYL